MLAKSFILPTSIYVAIALVSLLLIFPESLNRVWLSSLLDGFLLVCLIRIDEIHLLFISLL